MGLRFRTTEEIDRAKAELDQEGARILEEARRSKAVAAVRHEINNRLLSDESIADEVALVVAEREADQAEADLKRATGRLRDRASAELRRTLEAKGLSTRTRR